MGDFSMIKEVMVKVIKVNLKSAYVNNNFKKGRERDRTHKGSIQSNNEVLNDGTYFGWSEKDCTSLDQTLNSTPLSVGSDLRKTKSLTTKARR